jgi:signal transduction histidine kinase
VEATLFAIVALVIGLGLGWFLGGRPVAEWRQRFLARDGEAREIDEKFRRAITELAGASERAARVDALAAELADAVLNLLDNPPERDAMVARYRQLAATAATRLEQIATDLLRLAQ